MNYFKFQIKDDDPQAGAPGGKERGDADVLSRYVEEPMTKPTMIAL